MSPPQLNLEPAVSKKYRLYVVLRIILLGLLCLALAGSLDNDQLWFTPVLCLILIVAVMLNLIHFVERSNRDLARFLNNIYHQDFSMTIPRSDLGDSVYNLKAVFGLITESFQRLNSQKNEQQQLLAAIVEHLDVAVICVASNGRIALMNSTAKNLLHLPHIHHIDALRRVDPFIADCVENLVDGERQLIATNIDNEPVNLAIQSRYFTIFEESWQLVSLQNIRDELQQKEVESWQKLIRVLSHEILNSATPILSLSSAIKERLSQAQDGKTLSVGLGDEDRADLYRSIESIESRSRSLVKFVDAYRGLTRIPSAQIVSADVNRMLENIYLLLNQELSDAGIELELKVHKQPLTLRIDPQLVEQVLINLVKNAADALVLAHHSPHVTRRIVISTEDGPRGKVLIHVADNGIGVPKGELDNIFMPFYTTKRSGTGIGLSISRQIMFLNRGMLSVESIEGKGSRFTLEFNPLVKDSRNRVG